MFSQIKAVFRLLFHKQHVETELDDEVRACLQILEDRHTAAGLDREAARRAAILEIDGIEQLKENVREVRMGAFFETLLHDMRFAGRMMLREKTFSVTAVAVLALGIGATTAIFSLVDAAILRPLAFRDPDQLAMITEVTPGKVRNS